MFGILDISLYTHKLGHEVTSLTSNQCLHLKIGFHVSKIWVFYLTCFLQTTLYSKLSFFASYHINLYRSQLQQYIARDFDSVRGKISHNIAWFLTSTEEMNLHKGSTLTLHDVCHIPDLRWSLISAVQLDEAGFRASFSSGGWTFHKGSLLLTYALKVLSLYMLYVTLRDRWFIQIVDLLMSSLWHLNKSGITRLSKDEYIPRISFFEHKFCEYCQTENKHLYPILSACQNIQDRLTWSARTSSYPCHITLLVVHRTLSSSMMMQHWSSKHNW